MNDELKYPVILRIVFKRTNLKSMKNLQMRKLICFFLEEVLENSQISAVQNSRNNGLLGLQQEFDFGIAYLSGFDHFVSFTNHHRVYF